MVDKKDKKRLTLTGKNMPDEIYQKLEQLGNDRKLTPYIINLVEKEEMMDKIISSLSIMLSKIDKLDNQMVEFNEKLNNIHVVSAPVVPNEETQDIEKTSIQQGDIGVNTKEIKGEHIEIEDEYDF